MNITLEYYGSVDNFQHNEYSIITDTTEPLKGKGNFRKINGKYTSSNFLGKRETIKTGYAIKIHKGLWIHFIHSKTTVVDPKPQKEHYLTKEILAQ